MRGIAREAWSAYRGLWQRLDSMPVVMRVIVLVLGPACLPLSLWALVTADGEAALRYFVLLLFGLALLIATLWLTRFEQDEARH